MITQGIQKLSNGVTFRFVGLDDYPHPWWGPMWCAIHGHEPYVITKRFGLIGSAFATCPRCATTGEFDGLPMPSADNWETFEADIPLAEATRKGHHTIGRLHLLTLFELLVIGGIVIGLLI